MTPSLTIGPLSLPWGLVTLIAAVAVASFIGRRIGRRTAVDPEPQLLWMLAIALLAARSTFVLQHLDAYLDAPLGILDIRDGGWLALPGLLAAAVVALVVGWRRPALRRPVWAAFGCAAVIWGAGASLTLLQGGPRAPLPAVELDDVNGRRIDLQALAGRPVVINVWATWCPPCRREMPVLANAQRRYPDVHFVFLNQGETATRIRDFLATEKLPLANVLLDPSGIVARMFGSRGLPTTLFFDAGGRLTDIRVGELSAATLAARLGRIRTVTNERSGASASP